MMTLSANIVASIASGGVSVPHLLVGTHAAWMMISVLLGLCCGVLWLLTGPAVQGDGTAHDSTAARTSTRARRFVAGAISKPFRGGATVPRPWSGSPGEQRSRRSRVARPATSPSTAAARTNLVRS